MVSLVYVYVIFGTNYIHFRCTSRSFWVHITFIQGTYHISKYSCDMYLKRSTACFLEQPYRQHVHTQSHTQTHAQTFSISLPVSFSFTHTCTHTHAHPHTRYTRDIYLKSRAVCLLGQTHRQHMTRLEFCSQENFVKPADMK